MWAKSLDTTLKEKREEDARNKKGKKKKWCKEWESLREKKLNLKLKKR